MVEGISGLSVEAQTSGGGATVVRGARRSYCCTIEDPLNIEASEVPDAVVAAVLGVSVQYQILVEGSSTTDVDPAGRIARRLAEALGGAVVDPQRGTIWSAKSGRAVTTPQREEQVSVIDVDWCFEKDRVGESTLRDFLRLCRQYLPEAVPRRFGSFEPLQGRYDERGEDGLVGLWSSGTDVFWNARLPCVGGRVFDPPHTYEGPGWKASLDFLCEPFERDLAWRDALRALFVAVADELGAFYACAQVTGQHVWSRGGLWVGQDTERSTPVGGYGWRGLPPHPVWWSWYGPGYAPMVAEVFDPQQMTATASGLLHIASEQPQTRRELQAAGVPGPPVELAAREGRPAHRIPPALERLAGKRSDDDLGYANYDPDERLREELFSRKHAAEQLVVDDLHAQGVHVERLEELAVVGDTGVRQPAAVRVLAAQLNRDLPQHLKDDVVFYLSLARTAAAEAWPVLRAKYLEQPPDSQYKRKLADALAATVTRPRLPELIALAEDVTQGRTRARLIPALKRFKDLDAAQAAQRLLEDRQLAPDPPSI